MRHATKSDFLALSRSSESSLLLGSHLWEIHNDSNKCSNTGESSYVTTLTMHACSADYFACDSAFCIAMDKRCDAVEDCDDGSDEQDCRKLIVRQGYKKELSPVPKHGHSVSVELSLNILDIEVNEHADTFTSRISYSRKWFDGRLRYKHLKKERGTSNTLLSEESDAIWYPRAVLYNVRKESDVVRTDVQPVFEVIANNEFRYTAKDNMHIFEGSENALYLTKEYSVDWKCEYEYQWYPFDTQYCQMEFPSLRAQTEFYPTKLQHNPNISLASYTLTRIRMCKAVIAGMKAIVVEVTLGRPIINYLLTVFVPTALLVIISFIARLFAEKYIDMVIQVNVTIMLALSTM